METKKQYAIVLASWGPDHEIAEIRSIASVDLTPKQREYIVSLYLCEADGPPRRLETT